MSQRFTRVMRRCHVLSSFLIVSTILCCMKSTQLWRRQRIFRNFRRACEHRSVPMQFVDLVIHKLKLNTHWEDYYKFGFYRRSLPWSEKALYVNNMGSFYWPCEGNPAWASRNYQEELGPFLSPEIAAGLIPRRLRQRERPDTIFS